MAILTKDEFFAHVNEMVGSDTSDTALQFLEDMTDTYADLETRGAGDGIDWEQKYRENDQMWKDKYRHRFFSGGGAMPSDDSTAEGDEAVTPDNIKVEDLFN